MDKVIIAKVRREIKKSFPQFGVVEEPLAFITVLATFGITGKRAMDLYKQHTEELGRKPLPPFLLDMILESSQDLGELRKGLY